MNWLTGDTDLPNTGLLVLLAGVGLAVVFIGWQTWRCQRRHIDIDDVSYAAWDDQPPASVTTPAEGGRDAERVAS
jgi:hypothetical protein